MKTQLVIQLPISESTDFDSLIEIEEGLADVLRRHGDLDVEGHDIGQGRFNIFLTTKEPWAATFGRIRAYLEFREAFDGAIVATRAAGGGKYQVVWPTRYNHAP